MRKIFIVFLLVLVSTSVQAEGPFPQGVAEGPFHMGLPEGEPVYINFVVLEKAYSRLGIVIKAKYFPADRSLEESNAGRVDGEVGRIRAVADLYPNLIRVPDPVGEIVYVAFVKAADKKNVTLKEIKNLQVGIMQGFKAAEEITEGWEGVYSSRSWDNLLDQLVSNRLDVVLAPQRIECFQGERMKRDGIEVGPVLATIPLYHYLHSKHAYLVPAISEQLKEMKASGEGDALRQRAFEASKKADLQKK